MAQRSEARVWGFAKSGYLCAHQKRNTHSLSPFRFEEKARAVGRKAQWDPANQPASQPASSVRTCLPTFRLPAVPRVGTFNLQPAALKNAARECGNARESLQTLLQHFVMECFVAEGGREGARKGVRQKRREEKRDTGAAAHALLSSQQLLKKSAATAPPPSLQQNQQHKTNIRCSITHDSSLLLHEEHDHHQ